MYAYCLDHYDLYFKGKHIDKLFLSWLMFKHVTAVRFLWEIHKMFCENVLISE